MPFFPVDDDFWGHPKSDEAGDAALGLWVRAGSYCAHYLTEGVMTAAEVRKLRARPARVRELVDAGLWHAAGHECASLCPQPPDGGYVFHEWNKNGNRTREQVESDRAAAAERKRRQRYRENGGRPPGGGDGEGTSRGESRRDVDQLAMSRNGNFDTETEGNRAVTRPNGVNSEAVDESVDNAVTRGNGASHAVTHGGRHGVSHAAQARPGQGTTPLLTLVGRLAVSDARETEPPPAEQIELWQEIAGAGVSLEDEARAYLERNLNRPAKDEAAAWVGWLRKGAALRASIGPAPPRQPCGDPGCSGGWLEVDPLDGHPRPCPSCRPHLRAVPHATTEAS